MGKINEFCAGIDVGKSFLFAVSLTGAAQEEPRSQTRRFDATVQDLVHLRDWLSSKDITHVVMESTGSYWVPIYNILEGHFTIVLANPEEVKNRKGHKTDRKDAEHLADLLRHDHVRCQLYPAEADSRSARSDSETAATYARRISGTQSVRKAVGACECQDWQCAERCLWGFWQRVCCWRCWTARCQPNRLLAWH